MPIGKAYKQGKRAVVRRARKRYGTRTGGVSVAKVARDLMYVKRQLNVEHKHLNYNFGSAGGANVSAQIPTKDNPIILPLILPERGTNFNDRVGNQIRITHITSKLQFLFGNNNDLIQKATATAQIIFAKNADDVPVIAQLYNEDANGHYTPMSMVNTQEYKKFVWMKSLNHKKSHIQPTNRFPLSNRDGITVNPTSTAGGTLDVESPANTNKINNAFYYSNKQSKCSIRVFFKNLTDNVEQMKPYLLLRSDVVENAEGDKFDPVSISGTIRMTYVDN